MKVMVYQFSKVSLLTLVLALSTQALGVVHLTQNDFASGTYRIQTPDLYILDENIEFNPTPIAEATRTDKPVSGWFAAITVEVDNVVIDLNGKTLEAAQEFVDTHYFKAYANIELDNSPFGGVLFGFVGASFPGDTTFVATNNSIVKNGTLGRSSHWGIHGNTNHNIEIHDVYVKDFEVAGIEMNGTTNTDIHDVKITGNEHLIAVTPMVAAAETLIDYLTTLSQNGFPGAAEQLASLEEYVATHPEIFDNPVLLPPNGFYGLFFTSGFTSATNFPMTPVDCAVAAFLADGGPVENIKIKNIEMQGIIAAPQEFVLIGSRLTNDIAFNTSLVGLPVFGCGRWSDAFDAQGNFAPNALLQAQVFAVNSQILLNPGLTGSLPANYPAIAASILVPDQATFIQETLPIFGRALDGFLVKGVFGLRLDCADKGCVEAIVISEVKNLGMEGVEVAQLPAGQFYPDLMQVPYAGNDVWGYEFATCQGTELKYLSTANVFSTHGDSFGIHLAANDSYMCLKHCQAQDICAAGDNTTSLVNPPSNVYGFSVEGNSDHIKVIKSSACSIKAPRFAFGFAAEDSNHVDFVNCHTKNVKAISSHCLQSPKEAVGFAFENVANSSLDHVCVNGVYIRGEKHAKHARSYAAGIAVDAESKFNAIICPVIKNINGGAGKTFKILDKGFRTNVRCPLVCSCP